MDDHKRDTYRAADTDAVYDYVADRDLVATTRGTADHFDVSHVTARSRLRELVDADRIETQTLDKVMAVWWTKEDEESAGS